MGEPTEGIDPYPGDEDATSDLAVGLSHMFEAVAAEVPITEQDAELAVPLLVDTTDRVSDLGPAAPNEERSKRSRAWLVAAAAMLIVVGGIGLAGILGDSDGTPGDGGEGTIEVEAGVTGDSTDAESPAPVETSTTTRPVATSEPDPRQLVLHGNDGVQVSLDRSLEVQPTGEGSVVSKHIGDYTITSIEDLVQASDEVVRGTVVGFLRSQAESPIFDRIAVVEVASSYKGAIPIGAFVPVLTDTGFGPGRDHDGSFDSPPSASELVASDLGAGPWFDVGDEMVFFGRPGLLEDIGLRIWGPVVPAISIITIDEDESDFRDERYFETYSESAIAELVTASPAEVDARLELASERIAAGDAPPVVQNFPLRDDEVALFEEAERQVENYLAALSAGAWEQAGWPIFNQGAEIAGGGPIGDWLASGCGVDGCAGPYDVVRASIFKGRSNAAQVTVRHIGTAETSVLSFGYFEGQAGVSGLPPVVEGSDNAAPLVEQLFGSNPPERVVVERLDAFEIWDRGEVQWVTNPHTTADPSAAIRDTLTQISIEGDYVALNRPTEGLSGVVARLDDPTQNWTHPCPYLVDIDQVALVANGCESPVIVETPDRGSKVEVDNSFESLDTGDGVFAGWLSRGGTTLALQYNAEGAVSLAQNEAGIDILAGDGNLVGTHAISADGSMFVYGLQTEFHSAAQAREIVARSVETGEELARLDMRHDVGCIEASGDWIIVCEGLFTPGSDQAVRQSHLVSIHIPTGQATRVKSRTRVFLPTAPQD